MTAAANFQLNQFRITETRSLHNDTDYVTFSVRVGNKTYGPVQKRIGDVNNGTHNVGLTFDHVPFERSDKITIAYQIVNAGHADPNTFMSSLGSATQGLVEGDTGDSTMIDDSGNLSSNDNGIDWGKVIAQVLSVLGGFLSADCDGIVAIDKIHLTGHDIRDAWDKGNTQYSQTKFYNGNAIYKPAPFGCNASPSKYYVYWFSENRNFAFERVAKF